MHRYGLFASHFHRLMLKYCYVLRKYIIIEHFPYLSCSKYAQLLAFGGLYHAISRLSYEQVGLEECRVTSMSVQQIQDHCYRHAQILILCSGGYSCCLCTVEMFDVDGQAFVFPMLHQGQNITLDRALSWSKTDVGRSARIIECSSQ